MFLHKRLKEGKFPNCRSLAGDLEVSSKTIQRDIDFMRDRLNLPIEYDQLHFGFHYTGEVSAFPAVEITEKELMALCIAHKAVAQYQGTPFEKPLTAAFRKLSAGLGDTFTFTWSDLESAYSFRAIGATDAGLEQFDLLSGAVLHEREVEFGYRKLGGKKEEMRKVQPYHLGCVENLWYLFGWDLDRKQLRTFALTRIHGARDTRRRFRRPRGFSISKYLAGSFGVFKGSGSHKVRLRFDAFAGQLVAERQWHGSQAMQLRTDGGVDLTLQLTSLEEIERWVLSWGRHVKVIGPRSLVESVRESALALAKNHETA